MVSNYFIVFSIILFFLITLYSIFVIVFDKKVFDVKRIFKTLDSYGQTSLFLLFTFGIFSFIIFGIINSNFYNNSISEITKDNGLGSFGDYFNGLISPVVSIISIIYIYKAFVQQYNANEMLYNFELKRDIQEDLNWLRDNSNFVNDLESKINGKDKESLESLIVNEITTLNKLNYTVLLFKETLKKTEKNINNELNYDIKVVLSSFYLKSYKSIFREFNNYMKLSYQENLNYYNDFSRTEIIFVKSFIELYDLIKSIDTDKTFKFTINEATNNIKNGQS